MLVLRSLVTLYYYFIGHKSPSSSGGGLLGGGGIGLLLLLGVGVLIVGGIVLASFSNSNKRSFGDMLSNVDMDELAYQVFNAIDTVRNL